MKSCRLPPTLPALVPTHLELEGVAVGPAAEVSVPDGAVVHVLLGEGRGGGEAVVVHQRGAPSLRGGVSGRGHQHHLTWREGGGGRNEEAVTSSCSDLFLFPLPRAALKADSYFDRAM